MPLMPFGLFEPDKTEFNLKASENIINCLPTADGWKPFKQHVAFSAALTGSKYPAGAFLAQNDEDTFYLYVGASGATSGAPDTGGKMYTLAADGTWTDKTAAAGDYTFNFKEFFEFAQFGENVIAVSPQNTPQVASVASGAGQFSELTNAFQAEHIGVVGDFVVCGHLNSNKERYIKWSGVNDHTYWTAGQRGSDEQEMPDGGHIQGIIPQERNAYIIQETKIRRMVFDPGSNYTFRFEVANPSRGCVSGRAWANIGQGDFVYLARDGFYRGAGSKAIGAERVDKWFYDTVDITRLDEIVARADTVEKIVWWSFYDNDNIYALLGYDWQLDRWCYSDANIRELVPATGASYTVEDATTAGFSDNTDAITLGPDAAFWKGGTRPIFAGFDSDNKLGYFDGSAQAATIETERKMLRYPGRAQLNRASVLVDNNSFTVAASSTERPGDAESYGSDLSPEATSPWVSFAQEEGRFHRLKVKIAAGEVWTVAMGVDVILGETTAMF